MAHIRVTIQVGRYPDSKYDFDQVFPLDELIVQECFQPIDLPTPNADPFSRMLCTNTSTVSKVKIMRKDFSKRVSTIIAEAFKLAMEKKDLIMGYKTEEGARRFWDNMG
jgi:hypothetical protein